MIQKLQKLTIITFLCFFGFLTHAQKAPQYSNSQLQQKSYEELAEEFNYLFDNSLVPAEKQHRKYLRREMFEYLQSAVPGETQDLGKIMEEARLQTERKIRLQKSARKNAAIPNVKWTERGPNNVGGRSRGLAYDPNDATARKVWTGGIAGGIFFNNNIADVNSAWQRVDLPEVISVTAICFDPTNPKTMYVGTGEHSGGPNIPGGNVWKSTDNGKNWTKLPNNLGSWIKEIVVTKKGNIIAGTIRGLQTSTDGGETFNVIVGSSGGCTDVEIASDGVIYAGFDRGAVFKSTDDGATWTDLKTSETINQRIEIALAPSTQGDSQVIYAISGDTWFKKSVNGGKTWETLSVPAYTDGEKYGSGQVTYNMTMSVHPKDPNFVWLGGTGIFHSLDGGKNWTSYGYWYIHPDQHNIIFSPLNNGEMILANDGGIHFAKEAGNPQKVVADFKARNKDYNVTQFYSVAQRNIIGDNFIIGGAQDNSVINTNGAGSSEGRSVITGDGCFVFVDKDDPNVVISSTQNGNWYTNDRSGKAYISFSSGTSPAFVNPADYDSDKNILYANNGVRSFARCSNLTSAPTVRQVIYRTPLPAFVNAVKVAKNTPNTLFVGTGGNGRIYKITNIDKDTADVTLISSPAMTALALTTSNIDIGANDDEILVTYANFGTTVNVLSVWYTNDGGQTWASKDEIAHGLPNVQIRWTLFNPENTKQVITATRMGVYSTNDITAENPAWELSSEGLALTDCRMMNYRPADGNIALATGGRGFYTTDIFAKKPERGTINVSKMSVVSACADSTFDVHFTTTGNFGTGNRYQVILSGEDGTFKNETLIGTGFTSPVRVTLPRVLPLTFVRETALVTGNFLGEGKFKIKVVSSQPAFESDNTQEFSLKAIQAALLTNPTNTICKTDGAITIRAVKAQGAKYQWFRNVTGGSPVAQPHNSTDSSTFVVKNQAGAGSYFFRITQNGCTNQSANRTVTYSTASPFAQTTAVFTLEDIVKACEGKGVELNAPFTDTTFFNYQWRRNNVNITRNINSTKYQAIENGSYDLSMNHKTAGCSYVYRPLAIKLQELPVATLSASGATEVKYGNSTTLGLRFNTYTYRPFEVVLSDNQKITVNDTVGTVTVNPKKTGPFKVTSVSNLCGIGRGVGEPEIKVIPLVLNTSVADLKATNCASSEVSIAYTIDGNPEKDNVYTVQLSDETGNNFKNIAATGTTSPLKIALPKDLKSGNRYKVRVLASNPSLVGKVATDSLNVKALAVGTVTSRDTSIFRFSSVPVTFTLTGESPWTIQTSDNQTITATTSPQTLLLKPNETSTFSLKSVKDNLCGEGFARGATIITVLAPLSAEEEANMIFNVFPNPVEANVTVSLKVPSPKSAAVELIDLQGKVLQKLNMRPNQSEEMINMESLSAGTYLIHVVQDGKESVKKVIKIK
jgi:trimeric autotransporter adhesin